MVKNHSDSERGNLLSPRGLHFPISSKGSFMHHPKDITAHTTAFVTPVVMHWLERGNKKILDADISCYILSSKCVK